MESISISRKIPAPPDRIYQVCLNSGEHGAFTGSGAQIDPRISGPFIAWDGYITGITIDLELNRRIVRSWCTSDFPRGRDNSRIEFLLKETRGGTIIILNHTGIPDTQGDEYSGGGEDFCFKPMAKYFSGH